MSERASPVRSLAVVEYVSLDGVIQAPGHLGEDRDRLGIRPVGFPGDHQGFATHPGPFADTVHKAPHGS